MTQHYTAWCQTWLFVRRVVQQNSLSPAHCLLPLRLNSLIPSVLSFVFNSLDLVFFPPALLFVGSPFHASCSSQAFTADILSLLATTFENKGRDCLQYRLSGSSDALTSWGHEYVRHLQGEIAEEYKRRVQENGEDTDVKDLLNLAEEIVPYCVTHNAEADACDLLMEVCGGCCGKLHRKCAQKKNSFSATETGL